LDKEQLTKLLTFGIQRGVSDIHFAVGHRPHYRVKGELLAAKYAPMTPEDTVDIGRILLDDSQWEPSQLVRERDVSFSIPGVGRFRVHIFFQRGSVGIVIRVIPYDVRGFEALNLPKVCGDIASARRGLILVTGATGMGKSTTIAGIIKHINETRNAHVVTIEDPIEFLYSHGRCIITQREVGSDTLSYRDALIAALRQDPDVIRVGEVRENETAETCLKAAETGHLVISAIHTTDVVRTVERFVGMFPPEVQETVRVRFADCLTAIISLRLLVNKSGLGVIPAVEILRATRTVREYIRRGDRLAELSNIMTQGKDLYGMQTFDQHLLELYRAGQLKLEVGKAAASNPEDFERAVTFE
jgi:twitching motility protein PilT